MSCLVPIHTHTLNVEQWFNVANISTTYLSYNSTRWEIEYYGRPTGNARGSNILLSREIYPTKSDAESRMRFIEHMVNTKCGTTTFKIKKFKGKNL